MASRVLERPAPPADAGKTPAARQVLTVAVVLLVVQLASRTWAVLHRWFYYDDLIFAGRGASFGLTSPDLLLHDQDGHLMPGAFALAGLLTRAWPLEWWPAATSLLAFQVLASVAVLRMLRVLLGSRPVLLVPFTLYLFSTLTLPGMTWWAAGLNALPLQAGLAWVVADTVQLLRTGRSRFAVTGTIALALTFAFSEKAVLVVPLAAAVGALVLHLDGEPRPLRTALWRARVLWAAQLVVVGGWAALYLTSVEQVDRGQSSRSVALAFGRSIVEGVLPTLAGGPWTWTRIPPGAPLAAPPLLLTVASIAALVAAVGWSLRARVGAATVWWLGAGYLGLSALTAAAGRASQNDGSVLSLTLRWFPDVAVLFALTAALLLMLPVRPAAVVEPASPWRTLVRGWATAPRRQSVGVVLVGAYVAGSLSSTVTYVISGQDDRTRDYVHTAERALAATDVPVLDQPVPEDVLGALTQPNNRASQVLSPLPDVPPFADATSRLQMLDDAGQLVAARVQPLRTILLGPIENCGYYMNGGPITVTLDAPALDASWTLQVNYLTDRAADLTTSLGSGPAVRTELTAGLNAVYLRLTGSGDTLTMSTDTPGVQLCITSGALGDVEAD